MKDEKRATPWVVLLFFICTISEICGFIYFSTATRQTMFKASSPVMR